ncbi:hypothetical protein GCM10007416_27830 [Kroppenstedtia guangzhouensis]|jgi:hypothetical protein|uniref:Uncharacterized protein n=1 Tax=Kroppenstedtia guangzhouensis TaxID=1274356 RepID=A0ABQ1GZA6_9BACL|nr:hypothetical protein [Kroppenstedtia guangzhouensis]GGA53177.1 hypothetical protein GCM10007416_27830 [Kroppenstedtia guangzhouensis]
MSLTEEEKETVIQFDEAGQTALVYTASWGMARNLKRAGYAPVKKTQGAWWFEVPLGALSIQGEKLTMNLDSLR